MKTDLSCLGSNEKNVGEATGPRGPSERERASQTSQPQSVRDFNPITSTARPLASASVSEPLSSRPLGAPKRSEGDSTVNFPPDSHFQVFANQRLPAYAGRCGQVYATFPTINSQSSTTNFRPNSQTLKLKESSHSNTPQYCYNPTCQSATHHSDRADSAHA